MVVREFVISLYDLFAVSFFLPSYYHGSFHSPGDSTSFEKHQRCGESMNGKGLACSRSSRQVSSHAECMAIEAKPKYD